MLSTTQLLVEHIISGLLAMIWIGLGIYMFIDLDLFILGPLFGWSGTIIFLGAIAYPIGLIIDEMADTLLSGWNKNIKKEANIPDDQSTLDYLSSIKNENKLQYFTYNRFKIRIARSAFLNFFLIGVMIALADYFIVGFVFVIFSALALWLWAGVSKKMYGEMGGN